MSEVRHSVNDVSTGAEPKSDALHALPADEREMYARLLQRIADDPSLIQDDERLKTLIAKIHRKGKKDERRETQSERVAADRSLRARTAMATRATHVAFYQEPTPALIVTKAPADTAGTAGESRFGELYRASQCYVCKAAYTEVDRFYHLLCPVCAAFNQIKRAQRTDLSERIALLTGGRVKIGFQIALRLLRDGAQVHLTTRFPNDARRRFAGALDYADWSGRIHLHSLDLRNLPAVQAFAEQLTQTLPHLDILINNAAQTINRPLAFYQHLLDGEEGTPVLMEARRNPAVLAALASGNTQTADTALAPYFPTGLLDGDGQQEDFRPTNSWTLPLGDVEPLEALEVHLVNAVAPLTLCDRLLPLLLRSPNARRFIVNVSAMEGQFNRERKMPRHPHTNMAKAALNMLTRTSAGDLARRGIYMNSVDTGWVTDEKPYAQRERVQGEHGFFPPLDAIDGAARVYDPIARGIAEQGEPVWGQFLKDYAPCPW